MKEFGMIVAGIIWGVCIHLMMVGASPWLLAYPIIATVIIVVAVFR